jgi:hypothetical protein
MSDREQQFGKSRTYETLGRAVTNTESRTTGRTVIDMRLKELDGTDNGYDQHYGSACLKREWPDFISREFEHMSIVWSRCHSKCEVSSLWVSE